MKSNERSERIAELQQHAGAAQELANLEFAEFEDAEKEVEQNRTDAVEAGNRLATVLSNGEGKAEVLVVINDIDPVSKTKRKTHYKFNIDPASLSGNHANLIHTTSGNIRELMQAEAHHQVLLFQQKNTKFYGERAQRNAAKQAEAAAATPA